MVSGPGAQEAPVAVKSAKPPHEPGAGVLPEPIKRVGPPNKLQRFLSALNRFPHAGEWIWAKNIRDESARREQMKSIGSNPDTLAPEQEKAYTPNWITTRQYPEAWGISTVNREEGKQVKRVDKARSKEGTRWGFVGKLREPVPLEKQVDQARKMGVQTLAYDKNGDPITTIEGNAEFSKFLADFGDSFTAASARVVAREMRKITWGARGHHARVGEALRASEPTVVFKQNNDGTWTSAMHYLDVNGKLAHKDDGSVDLQFSEGPQIKPEEAKITGSALIYQPGLGGKPGIVRNILGMELYDFKSLRGANTRDTDAIRTGALTTGVRAES
ncbi:MAG TPA: hypothetical protein VEW42_04360, partial [Candidatus Eisenbacteria bacterium]|nr:hypothetical protein [Candidatus Eisenbacteria bacterium]